MRGLSSLLILKDIMDRINEERGNMRLLAVQPWEVFDLIGGTSTGGCDFPLSCVLETVLKLTHSIIAIMLGRLKMDVDHCIRVYTELSSSIFGRKTLPVTFPGRIKGRFDGGLLEAKIKEILNSQYKPVRESASLMDEEYARCKVYVYRTCQWSPLNGYFA